MAGLPSKRFLETQAEYQRLRGHVNYWLGQWRAEESRSVSAELALQSGRSEDRDRHFTTYGAPGCSTSVMPKARE